MSIMTRSSIALLGLLAGGLAHAEPLRIGPLALDQPVAGRLADWQVGGGAVRFTLGGQALTLEPAPLQGGLPVAGVTGSALREAHPAGPQTRVLLQKQGRDWLLLAGGLHPGAALPWGWTLHWRERPMFATAGGEWRALPADGRLAVAGKAVCVRVLDVRVPQGDELDREPEVDLLMWQSARRDCRKPGV